MKKVNDSLKLQKPENRKHLLSILNIKEGTARNEELIASSILSFHGIHRILSSLPEEELLILNHVFSAENGITFGEIEKDLNISTETIEKVSLNLSEKMLVYVLKNRQRLHNKLDKIYVYSEIKAIIHPFNGHELQDYLKKISSSLVRSEVQQTDLAKKSKKSSSEFGFLKLILDSGGIVTLEESLKYFQKNETENKIKDLLDKDYIRLIHRLKEKFNTYIVIKPDTYKVLLDNLELSPQSDPLQVNNQYYFLLNLLTVFDVISSNGLFFTKQGKYRKIDKKRIEDLMLGIKDSDGTFLKHEQILQLALTFYYLLGCLKIKRDAIVISLKNIEKDLNNPSKLTQKLLNNLIKADTINDKFKPSYELPQQQAVVKTIEFLAASTEHVYYQLYYSFLISEFIKSGPDLLNQLNATREKTVKEFHNSIRLLALLGIISRSGETISLTDIGHDVAGRILKDRKHSGEKHTDLQKKIYINPDFSMLIPKNEIPSNISYHLLTHSDIIKDDVILHATISRSSIIRAGKRGMDQKEFLSALENYSKNNIPQNLTFLLKEWSNQTVKLTIQDAILLHCSHPNIIDEIFYSIQNSQKFERISPHYAVVSQKSLDQIIKAAQKRDAVIKLFDNTNDDD